MAPTLIDSHTEGFADGGSGHVYTFGGTGTPTGAPAVGDLDVLCVNSITTVSTPSGFTARVSAVNNQGAYIFTRKATGGEGSTVTITTSGNFNTLVTWSRWSGTDSYSSGNSATADNSNGTALPALSTGTLAATGMLVIAFAALNNHDGDLATSPSWTNSWNATESASLGASGSSASLVAFTAHKTNAGTAAEIINSVTWTNNTRHRYALYVAFTAAAGGATHNADASVTATGSRAAAARLDAAAQAALTATANRTSTAALVLPATAALTTTAGRTTAAAVDRPAATTLTATADRTAAAAVSANAAAARATTATIAAAADVGIPPVEAQAALTVTAGRVTAAALALPAGATVGPTASLTAAAAATRPALGTLSASATTTAALAAARPAGAVLSAAASVTADAAIVGDIIFRPNTGTITRPNTGIILRP